MQGLKITKIEDFIFIKEESGMDFKAAAIKLGDGVAEAMEERGIKDRKSVV